jgi:nucleoside-diphosphate-sugar epimerase
MNEQHTTQTVLVTGGTGYLARWCIRELLNSGYTVHTTVRDLSAAADLRSLFPAAGDASRLRVFAADLLRDEGWTAAATGCDYVLHVASPFPSAQPRNPDDLIIPARDGTRRVLRAGFDAGARRVVVTSSSAVVRNLGGPAPSRPLTEDDWADPGNSKLSPYARSKTIAERSAWDYAAKAGATDRLAVVNPGAIIGPLLGGHRSFSLQTVERLLTGAMPAIPRLGFAVVDVRDVAGLHLRAMIAPEAAGQRFLGTGTFLWLADIAAILRDGLGQEASKVPSRKAPDMLMRLMSFFDPSVRSIIGELGQRTEYSTEKAQTMLGWTQRPARESVLDCARSILGQDAPVGAASGSGSPHPAAAG